MTFAIRQIELRGSARRISILIFLMIGVLLAGHFFALSMIHVFNTDQLFSVVPLLHFDEEQSLPTFVATLQIIATAIALWVNGRLADTRADRLVWNILAGAVFFVAMDEFMSLHERLSSTIIYLADGAIDNTAIWVVPYGFTASFLVAYCTPWFLRLRRAYQLAFAVAGSLFVSGSVGVEGCCQRKLGVSGLAVRLAG